jgi:hypothetical protein
MSASSDRLPCGRNATCERAKTGGRWAGTRPAMTGWGRPCEGEAAANPRRPLPLAPSRKGRANAVLPYPRSRWAVSGIRQITMKLTAAAAITYHAGDNGEPVAAISQVAMKGAKPPKIATANA